MIIVSDTSPITNLIRLGCLNLLEKLFVEVIIPKSVFDELADYEKQKEEVESLKWRLFSLGCNRCIHAKPCFQGTMLVH